MQALCLAAPRPPWQWLTPWELSPPVGAPRVLTPPVTQDHNELEVIGPIQLLLQFFRTDESHFQSLFQASFRDPHIRGAVREDNLTNPLLGLSQPWIVLFDVACCQAAPRANPNV